jgi:hypothetical protein
MIIVGLLGVFLVSYFGAGEVESDLKVDTRVAK